MERNLFVLDKALRGRLSQNVHYNVHRLKRCERVAILIEGSHDDAIKLATLDWKIFLQEEGYTDCIVTLGDPTPFINRKKNSRAEKMSDMDLPASKHVLQEVAKGLVDLRSKNPIRNIVVQLTSHGSSGTLQLPDSSMTREEWLAVLSDLRTASKELLIYLHCCFSGSMFATTVLERYPDASLMTRRSQKTQTIQSLFTVDDGNELYDDVQHYSRTVRINAFKLLGMLRMFSMALSACDRVQEVAKDSFKFNEALRAYVDGTMTTEHFRLLWHYLYESVKDQFNDDELSIQDHLLRVATTSRVQYIRCFDGTNQTNASSQGSDDSANVMARDIDQTNASNQGSDNAAKSVSLANVSVVSNAARDDSGKRALVGILSAYVELHLENLPLDQGLQLNDELRRICGHNSRANSSSLPGRKRAKDDMDLGKKSDVHPDSAERKCLAIASALPAYTTQFYDTVGCARRSAVDPFMRNILDDLNALAGKTDKSFRDHLDDIMNDGKMMKYIHAAHLESSEDVERRTYIHPATGKKYTRRKDTFKMSQPVAFGNGADMKITSFFPAYVSF
eukprot:TRINITY_DN15289_c0_g4_i1.p1 TRINITY_DN15289_c0_g4~~TRINITY_DN15289_c0_g4_i1.p1  ORF type:complete len:641 (-),score=75.98 TRINITY_DN15289_c0_g4_i1:67-1755(-)